MPPCPCPCPCLPETLGGGGGNRTRVKGFADLCLCHSATPPGPCVTHGGRRGYPFTRAVPAPKTGDGSGHRPCCRALGRPSKLRQRRRGRRPDVRGPPRH